MKKFKYRTESYLKFVKFERTKALKELKEAEAYKMALEEHYRSLEMEMNEAYKKNSQFGRDIRDLHFINDNNRYILKLKEQMQHVSQEISMAEDEFHRRLEKLQELQLRFRKIELHKENEKAKYLKEKKKLEQKKIDEINSSRR